MNTNRICYLILTTGVVLSTSFLATGLVLYFLNLPYRFEMLLGIMFLLFTPMATVTSTILSFSKEGERNNTLVSILVLLSMLLAFIIKFFR